MLFITDSTLNEEEHSFVWANPRRILTRPLDYRDLVGRIDAIRQGCRSGTFPALE